MVLRNSAADAGRKGAPSQTKASQGSQCAMPPAKGEWLPAYGDSMGRTAEQIDPQLGNAGDEVGNDYD